MGELSLYEDGPRLTKKVVSTSRVDCSTNLKIWLSLQENGTQENRTEENAAKEMVHRRVISRIVVHRTQQ